MSKKQSKYSKRRPAGKEAYYEKDVQTTGIKRNVAHLSGFTSTPISRPRPSPTPDYLPEYDIGLFIDDERSLGQVNKPNAKQWYEFTSYSELDLFLDELDIGGIEGFPAKTVFISFDHYLSASSRGNTGEHCMYRCMESKEALGEHIDIQGHSADSVKNDEKLIIWYKGE